MIFCTCIVCLLVGCWRHRCWQFAPVNCISRFIGSVEWTLRYTTPDIHCRRRQYHCDGGINVLDWANFVQTAHYEERANVHLQQKIPATTTLVSACLNSWNLFYRNSWSPYGNFYIAHCSTFHEIFMDTCIRLNVSPYTSYIYFSNSNVYTIVNQSTE